MILAVALLAALTQDAEITLPPTWAPRALTELRQAGLLVGYLDGFCIRGHEDTDPSRYEFAAASYCAYLKLGEKRRDPAARKALEPKTVDTLLRMVREFRRELQSMGLDEDAKVTYSGILVDLISWRAMAQKYADERLPSADASTNDAIPKVVKPSPR